MAEATSVGWKDVELVADGEDLVHEVPGDAERGHPLDLVAVVTVNGGEDILGLRFPRKPMAAELARRWNTHADLLAACKRATAWLDGHAVELQEGEDNPFAAANAANVADGLRAAVAKAEGGA